MEREMQGLSDERRDFDKDMKKVESDLTRYSQELEEKRRAIQTRQG
jgi:peptidoglycan hydrolase CwlO-like protein